MKYNLLSLTQAVLSSMDSDEVNSISDTTESAQVATLIRGVYFDILERAELPENKTLFNLSASGDAAKPVLMTVPDNIDSVLWLKYNKATTTNTYPQFKDLQFLPLDDFLNWMYMQNTTSANTGNFAHTIGTSTITFIYKNNLAPCRYTTFDDSTIIFDSYDITVDATLQGSKTLGYGKTVIPFLMVDTFDFPSLDEPQHALLLNEAKATAWAELKQTQHAKAEKAAHRQWSSIENTKFRAEQDRAFDELPNYGRR